MNYREQVATLRAQASVLDKQCMAYEQGIQKLAITLLGSKTACTLELLKQLTDIKQQAWGIKE